MSTLITAAAATATAAAAAAAATTAAPAAAAPAAAGATAWGDYKYFWIEHLNELTLKVFQPILNMILSEFEYIYITSQY